MNYEESKSYLAHITEDGACVQTVKEHLEGTAQLSAEFAKVFGCEEWGYDYCQMMIAEKRYQILNPNKIQLKRS